MKQGVERKNKVQKMRNKAKRSGIQGIQKKRGGRRNHQFGANESKTKKLSHEFLSRMAAIFICCAEGCKLESPAMPCLCPHSDRSNPDIYPTLIGQLSHTPITSAQRQTTLASFTFKTRAGREHAPAREATLLTMSSTTAGHRQWKWNCIYWRPGNTHTVPCILG